MKELLLVEDQIKDMKSAAEVARALGVDSVEARNTVQAAMSYLEDGLSGNRALPDGIVLDLDFGTESGYELLRFWHRTPQLARIPVMIWSVVEEQRELCELFKVNSFVSKWEGVGAFRQALGQLLSLSSAN